MVRGLSLLQVPLIFVAHSMGGLIVKEVRDTVLNEMEDTTLINV